MHRIAVIALCVFVASVCIIGLILGLYFGLRKSDDAKSNNIFRHAFSASLDIDTVEREVLGSVKTFLKVEWNPNMTELNFEQREVISSKYSFDFEQYFIVSDDKATAVISDMNTSMAFCISQVSQSQWHGVFQHIVTVENWQRGSQSKGCPGDAWITKQNDDNIEICIYDNELRHVTYQNSRATVTSWTGTFKNNITIAADVLNGPCPDISLSACSNVEDQPKDKRNTGVFPATCLFVHGTGQTTPGNAVHGNLPAYWGNVKSNTYNCISHKFLHYNSKSNGWDVDHIHRHFCDVAAPNGTISNTVMFSHSMGNLVIASALHRKMCTFDQMTSRWFSVQGPWTGSVSANTLSRICRNPDGEVEKLIRRILRWEAYCKPTENVEFEVYTTLKTNYVSSTGVRFDDLVNVGRTYVSGVMCGTSSWGLGEVYIESIALWAMQKYSDLEKPNDGMVAFDSCKLKPDVHYETRSSYPYYKDEFNHADGTCRNGGCPCKWYEHMH